MRATTPPATMAAKMTRKRQITQAMPMPSAGHWTHQLAEATLDQPGKILALEMGGKNAMIVLDDADLDLAASEAALSIAATTGQRCSCLSRIFVARAVRDAASLCQELGHQVSEVALDINAELLTQLFLVIWSSGCAWTIDGLEMVTGRKPTPEHFEPLTWALYQMGQVQTASTYLRAITGLQQAARQIARIFVEHDLLLTPTVSEPPLPLGTFDAPDDNPLMAFFRAAAFSPFTPVCNVTGQPAMSAENASPSSGVRYSGWAAFSGR